MTNNTFIKIFESLNIWEIQTVKGLLESNQIPCKVVGAHESNYPPLQSIEIQVPTYLQIEAKELIDVYQNAPAAEPEI